MTFTTNSFCIISSSIDWIKLFSLIFQIITTLTAILLPIHVLKETNKANKENLYLSDKITKYSQINGLLALWHIELLKINDALRNGNNVQNNIDSVFVEISKLRNYFDENSDEKFYELMNLTNNLLSNNSKDFKEDFNKAMNIVKFLQNKFTIKEES